MDPRRQQAGSKIPSLLNVRKEVAISSLQYSLACGYKSELYTLHSVVALVRCVTTLALKKTFFVHFLCIATESHETFLDCR
jgi:hypothetical protein